MYVVVLLRSVVIALILDAKRAQTQNQNAISSCSKIFQADLSFQASMTYPMSVTGDGCSDTRCEQMLRHGCKELHTQAAHCQLQELLSSYTARTNKFEHCRRSDVAALVLDASECADMDSDRFTITQQDFRLAELIAEEGRACVIVINKWDTVPNKENNTHVTFKNEVLAQLRAISWATVLFTSASTGEAEQRLASSPFCANCNPYMTCPLQGAMSR